MWTRLLQNSLHGPKLGRFYSNGLSPQLLRNYERFQKEDGIPVYLKGGLKDRMLVTATVGLIAVGLSDGLYTLFQMAKPKKKK